MLSSCKMQASEQTSNEARFEPEFLSIIAVCPSRLSASLSIFQIPSVFLLRTLATGHRKLSCTRAESCLTTHTIARNRCLWHWSPCCELAPALPLPSPMHSIPPWLFDCSQPLLSLSHATCRTQADKGVPPALYVKHEQDPWLSCRSWSTQPRSESGGQTIPAAPTQPAPRLSERSRVRQQQGHPTYPGLSERIKLDWSSGHEGKSLFASEHISICV